MASQQRPASIVVATVGAALCGLSLVGLAIGAAVSGNGGFSAAVALLLVGYGLGMVGAALALWRLHLLGRGPVMALSLLNLVAGVGLAEAAPWMWVVVLLSGVTAVAAGLPATGRALRWRAGSELTPRDAPQPKDAQ